MLRLVLGPENLARSRFAISPLVELESLLRALDARPARGPAAGMEVLRPELDRLLRTTDLRLVRALQSAHYGPGFLAPPPRSMGQSIDDDLAAVRATPLRVARAEIAESLSRRPVSDRRLARLLRSRSVVAVVADALEEAWHALVGPTWPATRALLERDVVHRASRLVREGWAGAFDGLHEKLRWRDGAIELLGRPDERARLGADGLLLVPSAHIWPGLMTYLEPPWPDAIVYPARGVAALWSTVPPPAEGVLGRLLGPARAGVLAALDQPASTTALVHLLGLPLGTVGGHLRVLHDAGLVSRARSGRSVLYRRTPVGDAVVGSRG